MSKSAEEIEKPLNSQMAEIQEANRLLAKALQEERHLASALRQQAQQLQQFFEVAKVGTWRWNTQTGEVVTSAQMRLLYGLDPTQLTGHIDEYYGVICPDDREMVRAALEDALATRGSYIAEYRIVKGDGSTHWISARGAVQVDALGEPIGMMGINADIDERKRAEIGLQESEHQFKTLADSIPQLAWMAGPDGAIFWYNSRWYEYTGTTQEQMQGWGWQSVHDPAALPSVLEKWCASIASGERFEMEIPLRGRDGLFRWFLTRVTPLKDSEERVVRWLGTNTDVTDIHQAREALRESEEQLRQLADAMPQLVSVAAADGLVQWLNQRWYAYSGMTPERSTGNGWASAIHPEDLERTVHGWRQCLAASTPFEGEFRWRRHDGAYRWFLCRALPVRDSSGAIVKWLATSTDVEDYRRASAEIRNLNQGLQERNQQLLVQTQRAEHANRAKSAFLAMMSHEIRTPMNAILGMADLLWESSLDSDQRRYVEVFRRAGNTLLSLINDILDLSKIEAGHLELEHAPFDIAGLAERSLELVAPRAKAKGIPLLCRIAPNLAPSFIGDASRLQQVLINLLGNAIKFTSEGEVLLNIERQPGGGPGCLAFSVKDSGIGIPADKHAAIFEDFEQADKSTTRQYGGTGLGLGICKRLVQLMGGDISLESEVGVGSTFRFTVALQPDDIGTQPPSLERPALCEPSLPRPSRELRILIADDSPDNRTLVEAYLKHTSYSLVFAENGREAVELFEKHAYDLVLMDMLMPLMDGLDATRAIRLLENSQGRAPVPVLALTANASAGDAAASKAAGCTAHLSKPISREKLLNAIAQYAKGPIPINPPDGLEKLVPRYLDSRKKELPLLRQAVMSQDFACIQKLGHNMKGTGVSYGFSELTRIGAALESLAKQASPSQLTHQLDELEQYIGRISFP